MFHGLVPLSVAFNLNGAGNALEEKVVSVQTSCVRPCAWHREGIESRSGHIPHLAVTIAREKGTDTNEQDRAERHGAIVASVSHTSVFAVTPVMTSFPHLFSRLFDTLAFKKRHTFLAFSNEVSYHCNNHYITIMNSSQIGFGYKQKYIFNY